VDRKAKGTAEQLVLFVRHQWQATAEAPATTETEAAVQQARSRNKTIQ